MDPVESVTRGTVSALLGSVGGWLHGRKRKARLRSMLKNRRFKFGRTIDQLAAGIGADLDTTRRLLVEIKARPSETNADLWTLKPSPSVR